jgi:hypothetical protein
MRGDGDVARLAIVEQSFPSADELDAAGVPRWAPRSSTWRESDGIYYIWSTGRSVAGQFFLKPGADRARTISRMVAQVEKTRDGGQRDAPGYPIDVNQSVAMVVLRDNEAGFGALSRPLSELRPLRDLLAFALEDLRRKASEDAE